MSSFLVFSCLVLPDFLLCAFVLSFLLSVFLLVLFCLLVISVLSYNFWLSSVLSVVLSARLSFFPPVFSFFVLSVPLSFSLSMRCDALCVSRVLAKSYLEGL